MNGLMLRRSALMSSAGPSEAKYVAADFFDITKPAGEVTYLGTYIGAQNSQMAPAYFAYRSEITKLYLPNYNNTANTSHGPFRGMAKLQYAIMPSLEKIYNNTFYQDTELLAIDWLGGTGITGSTGQFEWCSKLSMMVIRDSNKVSPLSNISAFNNTPFASGKSGGTLYVPYGLISGYETASNWATILGYPNNQIKSIESTHVDPNAPIDLTLYYADGTLIPTT